MTTTINKVTQEIRQAIKAAGYKAGQVSVRDNGTSLWSVAVRDGSVSKLAVIQALDRARISRRCYSLTKPGVPPRCVALEDAIAAAIEAMAVPNRTESCVAIEHDGVRFLVSDDDIRIAPSMRWKGGDPRAQIGDGDDAAVHAAKRVQEIAMDYNAV